LNPDARTDLFRDSYAAVTRSWIQLAGVQYAVKYVDQTAVISSEPPRQTALGVLVACLLLALLTVYRIVAGDFSLAVGWFVLIACAAVILVAGHIAFVKPGIHQVHIRFENGERIVYETGVAANASQFQEAVLSALDYLDYHDTDAAKPTVVLASLEPTQLSAIQGSEPKVVRLSDEVLIDAGKPKSDEELKDAGETKRDEQSD